MRFSHILLTLFVIALFSGCSSRSKGFFEDIYSQTEVRSATQNDYSEIKATDNAPIIIDETKNEDAKRYTKQDRGYASNTTEVYTATGKITSSSYDKDVNLYVYEFTKSGTSNSITFYYDKEINQIGKVVTITVKENFLTSISSSGSFQNSQREQRTKSIKRKRSRIKIPTIEKINTL